MNQIINIYVYFSTTRSQKWHKNGTQKNAKKHTILKAQNNTSLIWKI